MKRVLFAAVLLAAVFFQSKASAHAVWIEDNKVYFGEYDAKLHEKMDGKLGEITGLEAWTISPDGKKEALKLEKSEDAFNFDTKHENILAQAVNLPVKDMTKYKIGVAKPHFYARHVAEAPGDLGPEMRLDILPVGGAPDEVRVFFDGKPLGEEKAVLVAPNGWIKELKTDVQGLLKIERPWPGLYLIEVTHAVETPGEFEGKKFEVERHRATLSLEKK